MSQKFPLIGELRNRAVIKSSFFTNDDQGGSKAAWTPFCNAWVKIAPVSGFKAFKSGQLGATITHTVWMRYRPDVDDTMRISLYTKQTNKGLERVFNIKSVRNMDERGFWLEMDCEEVMAVEP